MSIKIPLNNNLMKILILTLAIVSSLAFMTGKIRKAADHGGFCEMDLVSDDTSETRGSYYYSYFFGLTMTDKANGEFIPGNNTGIVCQMVGDLDFFEGDDIVIWKRQDDLRCFTFTKWGANALYKILIPGKDYFTNEACYGTYEYLNEINKDCKLYWDADLFEVTADKTIAFEESNDWNNDYFFEIFNDQIDNTNAAKPRVNAYTLDGAECLGGKGAAYLLQISSVLGLLLLLL